MLHHFCLARCYNQKIKGNICLKIEFLCFFWEFSVSIIVVPMMIVYILNYDYVMVTYGIFENDTTN